MKNIQYQTDVSLCGFLDPLTHWGRVTHICISDLTSQRQAIIRTNAGILLIRPLGTNLSEILINILIFSFKKMRLKVLSAKRRPFCLGLNVLTWDYLCCGESYLKDSVPNKY